MCVNISRIQDGKGDDKPNDGTDGYYKEMEMDGQNLGVGLAWLPLGSRAPAGEAHSATKQIWNVNAPSNG